jgi:hypothetical protein
VRLDVETLLRLAPDRAATLLTTMTGGKLWLAADTARRLADTHGTTLRLVIHDHNRVVGVGRKTEKVPGWLAEATLALHDTCTAPGCKVAARVCDTDHAMPYSADGPTDIDNLAPLCATDNRAKEPDGWHCHQHPDGRRTWTHKPTGLTTTTIPATWTPPGDGPAPPSDGKDRAPPDTDDGDGDRAPPPSTHDGEDRGPPPNAGKASEPDADEGNDPDADDLPF